MGNRETGDVERDVKTQKYESNFACDCRLEQSRSIHAGGIGIERLSFHAACAPANERTHDKENAV